MKTSKYNTNKNWSEHAKANEGFRVPEGYFDSLPGRVVQRIKESEHHPAANKRPKSRFLVRLTAAAVMTGFFALAGLTIYEQNMKTMPEAEYTTYSIFSLENELEYGDEMLEYAMLDNNDIEYFLTVSE